MTRFFVIAGWEFFRHLKTRSFLLATFVTPLIFAGMVLIPSFYYEKSQANQDQVLGCVELDTSNYCQLLSDRLTRDIGEESSFPRLLIEPILPDTTPELRARIISLDTTRLSLDSLNEAYNKVKERRRYIFQRPASGTRENLLNETYNQLIAVREKRDLAEIEYEQLKSRTDSLLENAVIVKADSLLRTGRLSGYILFTSSNFDNGRIGIHSINPINPARLAILRQTLQGILVEKRLEAEGITRSRIQMLLLPLEVQEVLLDGGGKQELKFVVTYLAPVVVVLLLFISIFTASGFFFSSLIHEKSGHILESLVSAVSSSQLIGGKILGLGLIGIVQIGIWVLLTLLLVVSGIIPAGEIPFLTLHNGGLLLIYYSLGYLFFASLFVGVGTLSSTLHDAHRLTQIMRVTLIFPLALMILVLLSPNSIFVRLLSFIPFLSPTFMILRTPLGHPPAVDYYVSSGILVVTITVSLIFALRLFRATCLSYGGRPSLRGIVEILQRR